MARGVNIGPEAERPEISSTRIRDCSVRLVSVYDVATDEVLTRLDVLVNAKKDETGFVKGGTQLNFMVYSSAPGQGDLRIPSNGVLGAYAFTTSAKDLAERLRSMADAIVQHHKPLRP